MTMGLAGSWTPRTDGGPGQSDGPSAWECALGALPSPPLGSPDPPERVPEWRGASASSSALIQDRVRPAQAGFGTHVRGLPVGVGEGWGEGDAPLLSGIQPCHEATTIFGSAAVPCASE